MSIVIDTPRLRLRDLLPGDLDAFLGFIASARGQGHGWFRPAPEAWRLFATFLGHRSLRGFTFLAIEDRASARPIGTVGPWQPAGWPEPEIGWALWRDQDEGRGIAFEAATAARDHVFRDLGWTTAVSYIAPDNARSIALAERLGARRDPDAAVPRPGTLVYRHPRPEALQ